MLCREIVPYNFISCFSIFLKFKNYYLAYSKREFADKKCSVKTTYILLRVEQVYNTGTHTQKSTRNKRGHKNYCNS